ncbi:MAG: patatin-like phospholipase family protein [Bacteroidetes bacterium]|nr:patatin-like phospholipase family protein [Bacteroidota bacterium]
MAFKILSLDGGGSWAMIQARVLKDLYGDIGGHDLLKKFDLAIANSGGSLVLACLCCNIKLSDIISIFKTQDDRERVFSALTAGEKIENGIAALRFILDMGPKYSTERKYSGLVDVLAEKQVPKPAKGGKPIVEMFLDEIPAVIGKPELQLIIVGYDYFRRRANFFRSKPGSKTNQFGGTPFRVSLASAIHCSSNAPVNYFDVPATIIMSSAAGDDERSNWFWDGAISGFNNPVLAGVTEALTNDIKPEDMRVLALGTATGDKTIITDYGTSTKAAIKAIYDANLDNTDLTVTDHSFSFAHDIKELATSILGDPPDTDTFIAYSIMHPALPAEGNLVRINPCMAAVLDPASKRYVPPAVYNADPNSRADFVKLLQLDMDAVQKDEVDLIAGLCDKFIVESGPCVQNQLIRGTPDTKHLGYLTYADAKNRWKIVEALP